jgi:septal ring factor EnvC (AmiA/AmiB activator)
MIYKKIGVVILIFVCIAIVLYLTNAGVVKWQTLTILSSVLMAPLKMIASFFMNEIDGLQNNANKSGMVEHEMLRKRINDEFMQIDQKMTEVLKNINKINSSIKELDYKKQKIMEDIERMNLDEKKKALEEAFG